MKRAGALVVMMSAAASTVALAQTKKLEISGFVGGMSLTQDLGSASNIYMTVTGDSESVPFGKLFGIGASWAFHENVAAEFHLSRSTNAYSYRVEDIEVGNVSLPDQFEAEQLLYTGGVVVQYPLANGLVPYGTVGVGQLRTKPSSSIEGIESVNGTDLSFGGGVKYWIPSVRWLGLGFDLRYHTASDGLTFPGGDESPRGAEYGIVGIVRPF